MKNIILVIVIGLTVFGGAQAVYGCICSPEVSVSEAFQEATAVFDGRVTYIKVVYDKVSGDDRTKTVSFQQIVLVKIVSDRVWKGVTNKEFIVRTVVEGCGYGFKVGSRYLVYAYGRDLLNTGGCTRTKPFSEAAMEIKQLNKIAGNRRRTMRGAK